MKPLFRHTVFAGNVYMRRFIAFIAVKKKDLDSSTRSTVGMSLAISYAHRHAWFTRFGFDFVVSGPAGFRRNKRPSLRVSLVMLLARTVPPIVAISDTVSPILLDLFEPLSKQIWMRTSRK